MQQDQPADQGAQSQDFQEAQEPFALFARWMGQAEAREPNDPNAMALATVDGQGAPNVRMILLKGADPSGFVFYTNCASTKGLELAANPRAALLFHWKSLRRQIRIRGPIEPASDDEADAYFATRSRASRIGAWASNQSRPLASRAVLVEAVAREVARFGVSDVTRPPHWHGYRVVPMEIEFWQDRLFRLHDRIVFRRRGAGEPWVKTRLYP